MAHEGRAVADVALPTYRSLIEETDLMLKKQRQKGADYKFREGAGRPSVLDEHGQVPASADALGGEAKKGAPASPHKEAGAGAGGGAGAAAQPLGLGDYDPKIQAERERETLVATVSAMRSEASKLVTEVGELQRRYETAKIDLAQLAYEDDVDTDRQAGLRKMSEIKARTDSLTMQLDDTERTHNTLTHMLKRSQDEKLAHLATLKAFEDSIRVHRSEQELADSVLRQVQKSRDEEVAELHKMQVETRKHLAMLDRKIEARRLEVRTRQEKAKWRLAKLQEELQLKAQAEGDLTEEEERAMIEKAKNLSQEASELRAEKIRVQAEADAAEAEFHRVRFAAGVPGPGPEATVTEEGAPFTAPDPEPIIRHFAKLEDEVSQIEEQLGDYSQRLSVLQAQQGALRMQNQPRAKDLQDEEDSDVALTVRLGERTEVGKRALETAARELDVGRSLKLQLEQSLTVLLDRLELLRLTEGAAAATLPEIAEAEGISAALLAQDAARLESPWTRALHSKAVATVQTLQQLMRAIDVSAAASALGAATAYLQSTTPEALAQHDASSSSSSSYSHAGHGHSEVAGAGAEAERDSSFGEAAESDRRLEATIESLIVKNEWSIRVRPGSSGVRKTISGKVLNEAVQAFEKTWTSSAATASGIAAAAAEGEAGGLGGTGGGGGGGILSSTARTGASALDEKEKAKLAKKAKEAADASKPKSRDVQKFLATAAAMAGDDVEDALVLPKKDVEEVTTRDKLKRAPALPLAPGPRGSSGGGKAGETLKR